MPKIKTFTSDMRIFKTIGQLNELDKKVNEFIENEHVRTIYSVSDTTATDDTGATIGIIRVIAFD
jgi:hypothetical protein